MSKLTTFVPLTKLRPFKDNWRIQVKCLHSWKQNTPFAGDTFEMVLADQWGNKIHATSKRSLMQRIQRVLPIDSWGVIEHVTVTPAGGQYRTTNYKYKMVIAEDAVLSRSDLVDDRIFISLANYEEIENGTKKQAFLIDVIGRIHDLGDVQTVQVSGEDRKRVLFRLVDAEGNNLACCLWGTYAEQLEPFSLNGKDQTIICLIRFAKIKEFRGELQITNAFDATRLFLNAMIPEVSNITQRLSNDDLSVVLVPKPSGKKDGKRILYNWNDAEIKTIAEVAEANQVEICKIICTIEAIDTDWSWFYIGCNRHQKRVLKIPKVDYGRMTKKDKPMFRCELCRSNINTVGPKFKLHLVVKDDSATCNVMLLGSVGKSIVGVDAEELWDGSYEEIEDPDILPEHILSLVGKSFCFGISISSDNVTNGSDTFVVLEVCSGDKVLTIQTDSQSNSDMVTTSSTMSSGSAMMLDQISSDECPTPITKRKDDDCDLQDLTSSSKKQCTKIIKEEKIKND
ncbi:hypothetical protein HID58_082297 [Brassica napus]|uniref:(rape) hypothetical protein n=1 Tax=Brassica napus TaxID=3708 RepID=A0A816UBM3_BRANA|nr:hypothetical protein HID58_082297 [Brassica napus]CAF2111976.1 unnamed protein product [Brassica napus]